MRSCLPAAGGTEAAGIREILAATSGVKLPAPIPFVEWPHATQELRDDFGRLFAYIKKCIACERGVAKCDALIAEYKALEAPLIDALLNPSCRPAPDVDVNTTPAIEIPEGEKHVLQHVLILGVRVDLPSIELVDLFRAMVAVPRMTTDDVRGVHSHGHKWLAKLARTIPLVDAAVNVPGRRDRGGYYVRPIAEATVRLRDAGRAIRLAESAGE